MSGASWLGISATSAPAAKNLRLSRKHNHADPIIAVELFEMRGQVHHQFGVQRVRFCRAVQSQMCNPAESLSNDQFFFHLAHSFCSESSVFGHNVQLANALRPVIALPKTSA